MPWKSRRGVPTYFRSRRQGAQVISEYVGPGVLGELAEQMDRLEREQREAEEAGWRAERDRLDEVDRASSEALRGALAAVWTALEAAGWHRTRGEVRMATKAKAKGTAVVKASPAKAPKPKGKAVASEVAPPLVVDPAGLIAPFTRDECIDVATRASGGDESAVPRLLELLKVDRARAIRACSGDLSETLREAVVERFAGTNLAIRYAVFAKLNDMRAELSGADPSALEKLLIDQVLVGWLETYALDVKAQRQGSVTLTQDAHLARLRGRAQARYLRAIRALASVRKLPASTLVQVAVGTVAVGTVAVGDPPKG